MLPFAAYIAALGSLGFVEGDSMLTNGDRDENYTKIPCSREGEIQQAFAKSER